MYLNLLRILSGLAIALTLAALTGCEIEESTRPLTGDIYVSASDGNGNELPGGRIFLDGIERNEVTPDTLTGITVGFHQVRVKVLGFNADQRDVTVIDNAVTPASFTLTAADFGYLSVTSEPTGAEIIIDQSATGFRTPHLFEGIDAGEHVISTYIDGYFTETPAVVKDIVPPEDTLFTSFTLSEGVPGIAMGNIPPDFTLTGDLGETISLHEYRGNVVHISFFFKDCQPCMAEFPDIERAYREYADRGVTVLGINPMYRDDVEDINAVRNSLGLTFKLLLDEGSLTTGEYEVIYFPTNIILDPSGRISYLRFGGGLTYEELSQEYDRILTGQN